ncbi:GIY-YIG nuclease family protein [Liquorilactobacillus hordei]|nr:GIY-YIG nuclease family protein [Liquorilactobacillus hordei]QYH52380.1 GIY-YIG nuclease family protein [Liquorilactobacillus hordei DSM 19519]
MTRGKTIQLYLMDGTPKGRIKCTLANWTGVAYKIPRTGLEQAKKIKALKQTGVYFLFSTSDETQENIVYIGQAGVRKNGEGILYRLQEHKRNPNKDYWTEAVAFTTSNNTFGSTEISYLENKYTKMAIEGKRYIVKNSNEPNLGNVTEEKESELEEFISYTKLVIGALGYNIFEPVITKVTPVNIRLLVDDEPILTLTITPHKGQKIIAKGKQTSEGFVVFKGSKLKTQVEKSASKATLKNRELAKHKYDENFILLEDILFTSPSAAASFVTGSSVNGRKEWKDIYGKSINQLEKEE